jgi:hypothetical protein
MGLEPATFQLIVAKYNYNDQIEDEMEGACRANGREEVRV